MTATLPSPLDPAAAYRIALVCLGNICRSPTADVVLTELLDRAGLAARVEVVSSGTGGWHVGKAMDPRAASALTAQGYDATRHRARQFTVDPALPVDLTLAMDSSNLADVRDLVAASHRVRLFRDFDPKADRDRDVPDPYYGGDDGFWEVLTMVERTAATIVAACQRDLGG